MSAPYPPVARLATATRAGSDRPNEDRIFSCGNAVMVLDGASQPVPSDRDGGWLADVLGSHLRDHLVRNPDADLAMTLADAIAVTAESHRLVPGEAPSTTVSIVRWSLGVVDVLVLGDSPVVARTVGGEIIQVRDDRLSTVAERERRALRAGAGTVGFDRTSAWQALELAQRRVRNRPGGYWIAEADPAAAAHAVRATWRSHDVTAILAVTDGVAHGVDRYGVPPDWNTAIDLARVDAAGLVRLIQEAEAGDPDATRWPRSKRHDDKTVALVDLAQIGQ